MKTSRSGFTLLEVVVAMVIGIIIMAAAVIFFSYGYKQLDTTMKTSRGNISVFNVVEIIDSDLRKAGYGGVAAAGITPVSGNGSATDPLTIYYIDYTDTANNCDNQTWSTANPVCKYKIEYYLNSNNIIRRVYQKATGTGTGASMFDSNIVTVDTFNVTVDSTNHTVSYTISGKVKDKSFTIGDEVICRNW
ncbi:prepilin-type N-terminal cleavage/methylation domain-containing protein [Desulfurobacterium sp.]